MPAGARVYLTFLIAGLGLVLAPELLSRPYRQFGIGGLTRWDHNLHAQWDEAEDRLEHGRGRPGDDELQLKLAGQHQDASREIAIRASQTATFLLLALASLLFFFTHLRRALILRLGGPRRGYVERIEDERLAIDPTELTHQQARLFPSRAEAIANLRAAPPLRCGRCRRRVPTPVLGRIGYRKLVSRLADATPLGDGWWSTRTSPPPCPSCGAAASEHVLA